MDREVVPLRLTTIGELNPKIDDLVAEQIARATRDCIERCEIDKPRLVKIQIEVTPEVEDGLCEDVNVQIFIDDKLPPRRTRAYRMGVNKKHYSPFFAPDNPDNIRQRGLGFDGDDR